MSAGKLDFLFSDGADEPSNVASELSSYDRSDSRQPPTGWSAGASKAGFQSGRLGTQGWKDLSAGQAGPQGGAQGGSMGPALPFRIKETMYLPKASGSSPIFTLARPRPEEPDKADVISFVY
mmetsp:Transcript_74337/g.210371  ORF Transcript_74337/g.210371 Transcript_74337/m.210371 type:complete len:122 (-) Transcript_74337:38-403(-)